LLSDKEIMEEQEEKTHGTEKGQKVVNDPFQPQGPRDGLDNTGTQGYDSLKDDGYTGNSDKDIDEGTNDGTASVVTP
jgi:hypothetical protein